jgi:aerobic carbon-monoxide dehydrogenase large subunit
MSIDDSSTRPNTGAASGSILGTRASRTEDPKLLTGMARYLADLPLPDALDAHFVRSEYAHGVITTIHSDDALHLAGVHSVVTGQTLGLGLMHGFVFVHDDFKHDVLATQRVRFVGDPYAVVLANTASTAADAAELVWAEVDEQPAVIDPETALADGAPLLFPEHGSNEANAHADATTVEFGDEHVVRGRFLNQRMAVVSLEPDGAAAQYDPASGRLTVWVSNQMPHLVHRQLCDVLGLEANRVRVVTPQVGGGFGGKAGLHREYAVVAKCALDTCRPVRWVPSRSEDMRAMPHSRGQVQYVELGVRPDGHFTHLRAAIVGDAGAYPTVGAHLPGGTRRMAQGTYRFESLQCDIAVAVTSTTPMGAYRGAGRPEATAMLERIVDQAAIETGIDPIQLRRINLLADSQFPYRTLTGHTYDTGRYMAPLDRAAELVGYDALRSEQAERRATDDPLLLGIGVATYVEITAGGPADEYAAVEVNDDGSATIFAGTQSHGQGHQTAYAMLVADQTGIPLDRIELVDGDTDRVPTGGGTGGSRSLQLGGSAVHEASRVLVEHARRLAAQALEADVDDIVVHKSHGTIGVNGVPAKSLTWSDLASIAAESGEALRDAFDFSQSGATFPFGAHISVVEVDRHTGLTRVRAHIAVDDCGTVINPLLVEGQQHGGIAAGIGQALFEHVRYDRSGNPVSSNLTDYGIATAAELPFYEVSNTSTPTPLNPLGAKGIGEAATIGATPAVQNAVIDAVSHLGILHIDLPCTPERVWRAIVEAEQGRPATPWRPRPVFIERIHERGPCDTDQAGAAAADGI